MKHVLLFLFMALCISALAQPAISADEKKEQTVVIEPATLYRGIWRAGWGTRFQFLDKSFVDGKKQPHDENIWGSKSVWPLFAAYGITDRLMLKIVIPYVLEDHYHAPVYLFPSGSDQQYSYPQRWRTQARGFGDLEMSFGYQLVQETESRPAFVTFVAKTVPTGQKNVVDDDDENHNTFARPTGEGAFAFETAFMMRKISYPYAYGLKLFYVYRTETNKILAVGNEPTDFQNGHTFGASASFNAQLNKWIAFINQAELLQLAADRKNNELTGETGMLLQHFTGLSFQIRQFRIEQGMTIALIGNNVAADPAYHINLQYSF